MPRASAKSTTSKISPASGSAQNGVDGAGMTLDAPFRIAGDGTWFHNGSAILRPEMVRLFARALKCEPSGPSPTGYALVTPHERHVVAVDDAPFVAIVLRREGAGRACRLIFTTNIGAEVVAGRRHPIVVRIGPSQDPRPYIALDGGLEARLSRAVYYDLALTAEEGPRAGMDASPEDADDEHTLGVWSDGVFFPLDVPQALRAAKAPR
jgi:hypothetical protein